MQYVLLFLEGVITFVSPCILPMLPIFVSYFAGDSGKPKTLKNALGFVFGFTLVFVAMGVFSGSIGSVLLRYSTVVNIVTGLVVVVFGLNFLSVPTDCPQRAERAGWTGDAQVFAQTGVYNFNTLAFTDSYIDNMESGAANNGNRYFCVLPYATGYANRVACGWSDAAVIIPWTLYQQTGDRIEAGGVFQVRSRQKRKYRR